MPEHLEANLSLGSLYSKLGNKDEALIFYNRVLTLSPKHPSATHMLHALTGVTTEGAPNQFVENLFDAYSVKYEEHLVKNLKYAVPAKMSELIRQLGNKRFNKVIDLGCGTGLCAKEILDLSDCIIGVDLSRKMVEEAKKKDIYQKLFTGNIIEFLSHSTEQYNLALAADVFIYLGNLEKIAELLAQRLLFDGLLIFS